MAIEVKPIAPGLPATTAIQDPAVRRFAQAVQDVLTALQSTEGSVESLSRAAASLSSTAAGGVPPSVTQWLFSSEVYQKLREQITAVDTDAKKAVLDEALARQEAIGEINVALAELESTSDYDNATTYEIGDMVKYQGKLYRATAQTTGNLPTDTNFWQKVGDYASLGEVVAAHTLSIDDHEGRISTNEGDISAEVTNRQTLATQVRGSYTGTDVTQLTQGLIYAERVARSTADSSEVAARESLAVKILGQIDPTGLTLGTLASGLIYDERLARADQDGVLVQDISAVNGRVDNAEGLILSEETVRVNNDLAIVSAINTALAEITGVTTSVIQSGENLVANWSLGQATKWTQVEAQVLGTGGNTIRAALQTEEDARVDLSNKVSATWTVRAQVDGGTGEPYVAGVGLGVEGGGGQVSSSFVVRADKFAVVNPGYAEHVPFAIGPSNIPYTDWTKVDGTGKPEDGATVGAPAGTLVNGVAAETVATAVTNFNASNDRNGAAVTAPTVATDGTAVDHTLQADGSADISFEWSWSGAEGDIDGFLVYVRQSASGAAYTFGTTPAEETVYTVPAAKRAFILFGTAADQHYTFGVQAYRSVDKDINAAGVIKSTLVKATGAGENPYRPSASVAFSGNVTGTVNGVAATDVNVWSAISGTGKPENDATKGATFTLGQAGTVTGQITAANIATFIATGVIENAYIGNIIQSTNYVPGSAGWRINKDGTAEFRNVTVRGNVEASSLKANTAMVNTAHINDLAVTTLKIGNNAVTVPVTYTTASAFNSWSTGYAEIGSIYVNPEGGTVILMCSANWQLTNASSVWIRIRHSSGAVITETRSVGALIGYSGGGDANPIYAGTAMALGSRAEAGTYYMDIRAATSPSASTVTDRTLVGIGAKK